MAKFDGFSKLKYIEQGAKTATKMAGDTIEVTKLRKTIADNEDKIERLYKEIGKTMYKNYKTSNEEEINLTEIYENIDNIYIEIDEAKEKICEIKNLRMSSNCGAELTRDIQFCPEWNKTSRIDFIYKVEMI